MGRRHAAARCTPPIPPVAKTRIPAAWAAIIVAETVVAAQPPRAIAAREARAGGLHDRAPLARSRAPELASRRGRRAGARRGSRRWRARRRSREPRPPTPRATSRFAGYARPWLISGAVPATVAIRDGRLLIGLADAELERSGRRPRGPSSRPLRPSLAAALARGGWA